MEFLRQLVYSMITTGPVICWMIQCGFTRTVFQTVVMWGAKRYIGWPQIALKYQIRELQKYAVCQFRRRLNAKISRPGRL